MIIFSEAKIKHALWNYLETSGYKVRGEVKVTSKKGIPNTIDLVATNGKNFLGFEVKASFDSFAEGKIWEQITAYCEGEMLDELYIVVPKDVGKHVLRSYGHVIIGSVGVWIVDERYKFHKWLSSPTLQRSKKPKLKENEAWLKHILWNYFEKKGYDVEGEGKLLVPEEEWFYITYGRKWHPPGRFLLSIDLCVLPKGKNTTLILANQHKLEHIGIEVKYNLRINKGRLEEQLRRYSESKCITRLYLATTDKNIPIAEELDGIGEKFGVIAYSNKSRSARIVIESPKLKMKFDGFVYFSSRGGKIWRLGSPAFIPLPKDREFVQERFSRVVIYDNSFGKRKCYIEENISFRIFKSGSIEILPH